MPTMYVRDCLFPTECMVSHVLSLVLAHSHDSNGHVVADTAGTQMVPFYNVALQTQAL